MKRIMMHVGLMVIAEDSCKSDTLMNYALNSLTLSDANGMIRSVEVREVSIPTVEFIDEPSQMPAEIKH